MMMHRLSPELISWRQPLLAWLIDQVWADTIDHEHALRWRELSGDEVHQASCLGNLLAMQESLTAGTMPRFG